MRFGIDISPVGEWGDPRRLAELAALAERSGWNGVFVEDYVFHPEGLDAYDPWIALAAIALATERVRIGTLITPVPRRRSAKLAAEAMTIDHLSGGRMILGVGSGDPQAPDTEGALGERARRLDDGLAEIDGLWQGALRPRPLQRPRIPIWVGGQYTRGGPRERALRWDGSCLYRVAPPGWEDLMPDDVAALRAARPDAGFDIAVGGRERDEDEAEERRYLAAIEQAGATWWHEWLPPSTPLDAVRAHIAGGPLARP
jgi:alkanesulfonate monooxygenase SsuD/methylene tetrahydromethanopterin reductase-like flavin-dependent oxidoreductase (luciferase family)